MGGGAGRGPRWPGRGGAAGPIPHGRTVGSQLLPHRLEAVNGSQTVGVTTNTIGNKWTRRVACSELYSVPEADNWM